MRIPVGSFRRSPWGVERHLGGHRLEPLLGDPDLHEHMRRQAERVTGEALGPATNRHHVVPVVVGVEQLQAQLGDESEHMVLRRPHPLSTDLDDGVVGEVVVQHTAPHPITCLENGDIHSRLGQQPGGTQSGQTRTDDDNSRHDPSKLFD